MKQKVLSMLVLLAAVVTGARADQLASSYSSNATLNEVTVSASMEVTIATGVTVTINNGLNITSGTLTVKGPGTLVVNGKAGSNGGSGMYTGGNGTPGSAAITGNIKVMDNATIQANGGAGGNGGKGDLANGGNGANGAAAITGNIIVQGGATVKATGGNGGNGGNSGAEDGGKGAQGGAAITGEVTIQDASTLEATGGNGGKGGNGNRGDNGGGNGGVAFAGTLTYKGGTVTADGGNGGSGGWRDAEEEYGPSGSAGNAFTTSVNFVSSHYILTDGSNTITATQVTSKKKVVINPKVAVNSVTLSQTAASMTVGGETLTLTPTVLPADATDKTVTWTTSDESVATVADGVVTAVAAGTATITATANDGSGVTGTCTVTVTDPATKYNLTVGKSEHGSVAFTVGGNPATQAKKDDVVTVTVTPEDGYSAENMTVRAFTSWEAGTARRMNRAPGLLGDIDVTKQENGTWTFTMPEADVTVEVTYAAVVDKTALNTAITEAETYYNSISESNPEAATTLQAAINAAKGVQEKGNATQEQVDNAKTTLDAAVNTAKQAVLTETKNKLAEDITAAETYHESIMGNHSDAATALKTAIDNANAVKDKADATQSEVDEAIAALAAAKTTAEGAVLTDTKNELAEDITAAETYYESIMGKHSVAATALKTAIDNANAVKDKADATQSEVDDAIAALASAKTTAEGAVLTEAKTALDNAITEAEAYYSNISESNLKATDLLTAINAAKAVKNNASATQTEIETAAETLTDALDAAKADDALKRIAITIPAKSYVTRFDADKRQIETAVEGVSLYTVTGVTDKQVTLSAALNVVAAEMPYLIYNDNDEEKTINLIVSSEDADNVTVAAEFKGTLVDKTFTDEDMEEADHYVLSHNNFVWVKDAGTLAGGKCWIELTKAAGARRLSIVAGGEATGIDLAPVLTEDEGAWYDLNGRRVVKPTKKGLYIKNGKKYVVK